MSPIHHHSKPPSWEELKLAMASDATSELRNEIKSRLKMSTPSDEAVLGARDFLEDNGYDFDALRNFILPESQPSAPILKPARITGSSFYRIAAAAILMAAMAYGGWNMLEVKRHRKITDIVFYEPGLPVFASLTDDKLFQEMMTAFRLQESTEGLQYIDSLEKMYGRNDTLSYYAGWLYYFDHAYDPAAERFEAVEAETNSIYHEKAGLMLGASLYLAGRKKEAREQLEQIIRIPGHSYTTEAQALLNEENRSAGESIN